MSHIFDALVRSKREHPEDEAITTNVTRMLEQAEQQAALQRSKDAEVEKTEAAASGTSRMFSVANGGDGLVSLQQSLLDGREEVRNGSEIYEVFQSTRTVLGPNSHLVSVVDSGSPAAEAFRLLGVRLRHLRRERRLHKILITSTAPQEGKSTVSANLACALAAGKDKRVLLLEGDLRRPTLAKIFGVKPSPGLSNFVQNQCELNSCIYHLENIGLWLLPAGDIPDHPLECLQAAKLHALMQSVEEIFDWIIIDSPPFLPLADSSIWERTVDGVICVVRHGITKKAKLQKGVEAIDQSKLLCGLLNSSSNENIDDYYYYRDEKH